MTPPREHQASALCISSVGSVCCLSCLGLTFDHSDDLLEGVSDVLGSYTVVTMSYSRLADDITTLCCITRGNQHDVAFVQSLAVGIVTVNLVLATAFRPNHTHNFNTRLLRRNFVLCIVVGTYSISAKSTSG